MTREQIAQLIDEGFSDDEIEEAASRMTPRDPRRDTSSMRPPVKPDEPSGPLVRSVGSFHAGPAVPAGGTQGTTAKAIANMALAQGGTEEDAAAAIRGERRRSQADENNVFAHDPMARLVAEGTAGGGAAKLVGGMTSALAAPLLGASSRAARYLGRGLVGGSEGMAADAATGNPGFEGPGDALPIILGAAGRMAGEYGRNVRDPATATGRNIRAIEEVGGRTGVVRPARGGMFDEPGYRSLPDAEEGTAQMARGAEGRINASLEAREAARREALQAAEDETANFLGRMPISTEGARRDVARVRAQSRGPNGPTLPQADAALEGIDAQLTGAGTRASLPPSRVLMDEPNVGTFGELRALHKALNQAAEKGDPLVSGANQQAAGAVRRAVRGADPRFAQALDDYSAESQRLTRANDLLYGADDAISPTRAAKERAGTRALAGAGAPTSPDRIRAGQLDELAGLDPVAAVEIPRLRGRNAAEALSFGLPQGGAGLWSTLAAFAKKNAGALDARVAGPAAEHVGRATVPLTVESTVLSKRKKRKKTEEEEDAR